MRQKRMFITGISGLLGNNLAFCLRDKYDILGAYCTHKVLIDGIQTVKADILSMGDVNSIVNDFRPEIIVHCAAHSNVEICEMNHPEAENLNVLGTRHIVNSLNNHRVKFVYISTDLVYDGKKENCRESDPVNPLNYYGKTKYEGEQEALKAKDALILRTNFFGWNILDKLSFGEWVIHELTQERTINGFIDCFFSSIYTFEFAKILDSVLARNLSGLFNCGSSTSISKYEFARQIAGKFGLNQNLIKPISIDDFGFRALRGKNLTLDTHKLASELTLDIPSISYSIDRFVEDFHKGIPQEIKGNQSDKIAQFPLKTIPYGRQWIDEEDIQAVEQVLRSASLTQGSKVSDFEAALCEWTGARYAVAVNSGTSALHIACLAAEIGPGKEAITSSNTFVASANCVVYCGGTPVFGDIDSETYNLDPLEIEKKITNKTRAIIPVHFAGQSCDMKRIEKIVRRAEQKYGHRIFIIEDAAHALGSVYDGKRIGGCYFSDMAIFSFHPVKHVTTGEGGAVLTDDEKLYKKLKRFRSHGITNHVDELQFPERGREGKNHEAFLSPWYYEQQTLGFNYRVTDIQCALGLSQLRKLPKFIERRRKIVQRYNDAFLSAEDIQIPHEATDCISNFHLYVLLFDFKRICMNRAQFMNELLKRNILTQVHYIPLPMQPFFQSQFGTSLEDFPRARHYYERCLSLPLFPKISDAEVDWVISSVLELVSKKPSFNITQPTRMV